jgi:glyoxylase-like metal-dependent hydrolase (beta-lactamase superfamily II)
LRAILLTHAHWDHASGVADLAGTPVWVGPGEKAFIYDGGALSAVARMANDDYREMTFDGGPYRGRRFFVSRRWWRDFPSWWSFRRTKRAFVEIPIFSH